MKIINLVLILLLFTNGCATLEHSGLTTIAWEKESQEKIEIKSPLKTLQVGEKLTYSVRWLGIPVGTAVLSVRQITTINGRPAYHVVSTAKSNKFISTFYRVDDTMQAYIDRENLYTLRFEKHQREGAYRADETIDYDQVNHTAVYESRREIKGKKTVKGAKMSIPEKVQDALSCLYYFRTLDGEQMKVGKSIFIKVNTEEKNWDLEVKILESKQMELLNMGAYDAFLVEPKAKFKGIFVRKGRMWIWVSADEKRIPLIVKTKIPVVGTIYVTLRKIEYL